MFKFIYYLFSKEQDPLVEIIRAVRILAKKKILATLVIEPIKETRSTISSQEIVGQALICNQGAVKLDLSQIKAVNCRLPFPNKVCDKEYTDQELACLGISQHSQSVIVAINQSGQISICYLNSIKKNITWQRLRIILEQIIQEKESRPSSSLVTELYVNRG